MKTLHCIAAILFLAAVSMATTTEQWPSVTELDGLQRGTQANLLNGTSFAGWKYLEAKNSDRPVMAFGEPVFVGKTNPEQFAIEMIREATGCESSFEVLRVFHVRGLTRIHYRETVQELPVLCGRAEAVINSRDEMIRWSLREHSNWAAIGSHSISLGTAASSLGDWSVDVAKSFAGWFPVEQSRELIPVYWIRIQGEASDQRREGIVDARNGRVVMEWPGIETDILNGTASGDYWPMYEQEDPSVGAHGHVGLSLNENSIYANGSAAFSGEAGQQATVLASLQGLYVDVANEDGPDVYLEDDDDAPFAQMNIVWTTDDASPPELNLYYHTEFIHGWYKVLDPDFSALDYPVPAVANVGQGYDNAYWNGEGTYYGSGSQYQNFAMFSDVIYHEYTHGVTDGIYPDGMLPYEGQPGAMNEAWSDYFACTINGDPLMAEWIGGGPGGAFRNLENTKVFPINWVGEVHGDSEFISGALWIIRAALGAEEADALAHFARYGLAENFFDYLVSVLETDDDDGNLVNGTPNDYLIYNAFGVHGIGPGVTPHFTVTDFERRADGQEGSQGDGDEFMESGERASISFRLTNASELYPPPATGVTVTVSSDDPMFIVSHGNFQLGDLAAGAHADLSEVYVNIFPSSTDHWAVLNIAVTSNGGDVQYHTTYEFPIGVPRILIVEDDPTSDAEQFVRTTVRNQDVIYDHRDAVSGDLSQYNLLIWLTGNVLTNPLSDDDVNTLVEELYGGKKVVLSGQRITDGLEGSAFVNDVLNVDIDPDSTTMRVITTTDSPFENGDRYLLAGTGGASNQAEMTSYTTQTGSESVGHYGYTPNGSSAAVTFWNGNGLLCGFGLEAISDSTNIGNLNRATFMNHIYDWAGIATNADESSPVMPMEFSLGAAYPNPFNSSTSLPYVLPAKGGEYSIFDVLGRQVTAGKLAGGLGELHWSASGASGIYFVNLKWDGGQAKPMKVVLLR